MRRRGDSQIRFLIYNSLGLVVIHHLGSFVLVLLTVPRIKTKRKHFFFCEIRI